MSRPRNQAEGPARDNQRPEGVSDDVVAAVGKLNEAVETIERARGHLYSFHQLTGGPDGHPVAAGEVDAGDHVDGVAAARHRHRVLVDHAVVDGPGLVVPRVAGTDQRA